jgi:hypothetical protein
MVVLYACVTCLFAKVGPIKIDSETKLSAATQQLVDDEIKALLAVWHHSELKDCPYVVVK